MPPELLRYGGGGDTLMHPLAAFVVLIAIIFIFVLPRKYVIARP